MAQARSLSTAEPPHKRARLDDEVDLLEGLAKEDLLFSDELEAGDDYRGDAEVPAEDYEGIDGEEIDEFIVAEGGSQLVGITEEVSVAADDEGRELWELTSNTASQRTAVASQPRSPPPNSSIDEHYTPAQPMMAMPAEISFGGFSTGLGRRALPVASEAALKRAQALVGGISGDDLLIAPVRGSSREGSPAPRSPSKRPLEEDVFGAGRQIERPNRHPLAQMTLVADENPSQPASSPTAAQHGQELVESPQQEQQPPRVSQEAMPPPALPSPAVRRTPAANTTPFRAVVNRQAKPSSAFRAPFAARVASPLSTPVAASPGPSTPRRLQLGMSPRPRSTPSQDNRPGFATPFKNGKAPAVIDSATVLSPRPRAAATAATAATAAVTPIAKKPSGLASVFNRSCAFRRCKQAKLTHAGDERRFGMQGSGLQPPRSIDDCLVDRPPNDMVFMTFERAAETRFGVDGNLGPEQALQRMRAVGATYSEIDLAWVRNHWQLIVWKLAAIGRAKPADWRKVYNYTNVVNQLLYRYEREVNLVHRSAIKRIQEHDGSPAQSMVLCVTKINWIDAKTLPKAEGSKTGDDGPMILDIEVTDGWYRMRANIDQPIGRACVAYKIRPGVKLAIARASLSSLNGRRQLEGTDVMDAHDSTALMLNGNATSLARWDDKLGFRSPTAPVYISTLRALTADGGVVPMIDIVIAHIYPSGYAEPRTEQNPSPAPWTPEEDVQKQREWEMARETAYDKASSEIESSIEKAVAVADRIERAADNAKATGHLTTQDSVEGESALEDYDDADDKPAFLRSLSPKTLRATAEAARQRVQQIREAARDQVTDLVEQLVPRRRITRFCCVRVVDYHETARSDIKREALLTVWNWDDIVQSYSVAVDKRFQPGRRLEHNDFIGTEAAILEIGRARNTYAQILVEQKDGDYKEVAFPRLASIADKVYVGSFEVSLRAFNAGYEIDRTKVTMSYQEYLQLAINDATARVVGLDHRVADMKMPVLLRYSGPLHQHLGILGYVWANLKDTEVTTLIDLVRRQLLDGQARTTTSRYRHRYGKDRHYNRVRR